MSNLISFWRDTRRIVALIALAALSALYLLTLQTHISGSFEESDAANILKNEYIKDVSEIQVALNVWGTLHHTGYPLYAVLGNVFTLPWRWVGLEPAAAASLYALAWGAVALGAFGLLIMRLTRRPALAGLSVLVLGTARSIWLHNVIAEVYSMSLAITALLLLVALWPAPWTGVWSLQRRVLWLALLGGIGVSHHRAVAFIAPGLLAAIWPHLWPFLQADRMQARRLALASVGLALLGFVPYIYLPIREWQDGAWVYGEPGTWSGLWTEFTGREADRLVKLPQNLAGLWDNFSDTLSILVHELTLPGLVISVLAVGLAVTTAPHRRAARLMTLSAVGPLLFAIFYHTAVLPQAILMPVVLALIFNVALAVDGLLDYVPPQQGQLAAVLLIASFTIWTGNLVAWEYDYINELVTEPSGEETIALLRYIPRVDENGDPIRAALMLPWGPHYAATAYAALVTEEYPDLVPVDHKGDYPALLADGYRLYTLPETFYTYPPPWASAYGAPAEWWRQHLGALTLTSAAPGIVQLQNTPWLVAPGERIRGEPVVHGILRRAAWLTCDAEAIYLHVVWSADQRPDGDPSIFVHLTGDEPAPDPPNADSRHPVYGAYPFAAWSPGEIVRDDFTLPRLPDRTQVRFGLYEQNAAGQFVNYGEMILPVADCQPVSYSQ